MERGAIARRRHVELAGIGLGVGDELGNRLGWNRWVHDHDVGRAQDAGDRSDIADEIEVEPFVKRRADRVVNTGQEERVSVRGRTRDRLGGDIAGRAWPVVDDEWLAKPLRQPLTHQARDDVIRTAWSKADHNVAPAAMDRL